MDSLTICLPKFISYETGRKVVQFMIAVHEGDGYTFDLDRATEISLWFLNISGPNLDPITLSKEAINLALRLHEAHKSEMGQEVSSRYTRRARPSLH